MLPSTHYIHTRDLKWFGFYYMYFHYGSSKNSLGIEHNQEVVNGQYKNPQSLHWYPDEREPLDFCHNSMKAVSVAKSENSTRKCEALY